MAKSVDDITTDQQRNAKSALFHSDPLKLVDDASIGIVEHRADLTGTQTIAEILWRITPAGIQLNQLSHLLGDGHLVE